MSVVIGPVPVRRLGNTLFVETVPARWCSYACAYCRGEGTECLHLDRSALSTPESVVAEVAERLAIPGTIVDRIAIAADGEPTLDAHLGRTIEQLGELGVPIAVLSNGSLLTRDDVRAELGSADFVSLTFDAALERSWKRINVPHPRLRFDLMLQGFRAFAAGYDGQLATETMLLDGINTSTRDLEATADFISRLEPEVAFLAVPADPGSAAGQHGPALAIMERAAAVFSERLPRIECLAVASEDGTGSAPGRTAEGTPYAARCFASHHRRNGIQTLRPLAAARPAAAGPSLAQARLPAEALDDDTASGPSQAQGSEGQ